MEVTKQANPISLRPAAPQPSKTSQPGDASGAAIVRMLALKPDITRVLPRREE